LATYWNPTKQFGKFLTVIFSKSNNWKNLHQMLPYAFHNTWWIQCKFFIHPLITLILSNDLNWFWTPKRVIKLRQINFWTFDMIQRGLKMAKDKEEEENWRSSLKLLSHDKHNKGFQHKVIAEPWIWGTLP
jgi:hypothetical protein